MMLAIAPHLVRRDKIAQLKNPPGGEAVARASSIGGVAALTTDDKRIADLGSATLGRVGGVRQRILDHVTEMAGGPLKQLLER